MIYDISYKTLIGPKPLRIRFDKTYGFNGYDGTRYLTLFASDAIYSRIRYLITRKSSMHMFLLIITQKSKLTLIEKLKRTYRKKKWLCIML